MQPDSFCVCLHSLKTFMFEWAKRGQRKYFFFSTSESDGVFQMKFTQYHDKVMFSLAYVCVRAKYRDKETDVTSGFEGGSWRQRICFLVYLQIQCEISAEKRLDTAVLNSLCFFLSLLLEYVCLNGLYNQAFAPYNLMLISLFLSRKNRFIVK